ncbi:hypothetical protein ELI15_14035 [Rhizobium ruizarguesonis]|uniref:hypothetical protein n=1 Tax=Rhizobium ruizarguesonis TaxID=2081791 RepID=UPI00102FD136|nr:hypothetical protein [Rhizobium ruizarguesonis]TAW65409.1 hypothetical protein ELI15_14035 [Rhizobium ruizarguesonis]
MNPNLSDLTPGEIDDYFRRREANCQLYGLMSKQAETAGDGRIARIASALALKDVRNRRQLPGRTR